MKTCSKCKKELHFKLFSKDKSKIDGYYSQCKSCKKEYLALKKEEISSQRKEYWNKNKGSLGTKAKAYRLENRDALIKYSREYRENNPLKLKAHQELRNAIRNGGKIKPSTCSSCLSTFDIEGHHTDYNKPLEVVWLCRCCHKREHVALARNKKIGLKLH